jgi:hypothetical protein
MATIAPVRGVSGAGLAGSDLLLQPGQTIEAALVALAANGNALLTIKGQLLQALLDAGAGTGAGTAQKLAAGQTLTLQVTAEQQAPASGAQALPVLKLINVANPAGEAAGAARLADAPGSPAVAGAGLAPATASLRAAIGIAAAQQNSLAPLFADLEAALLQPLPGNLRQTVTQLLALRLSPSDPALAVTLAAALPKAFAGTEALAETMPGLHATAAGELPGRFDLARLLLQLKGFLDQFRDAPEPPAKPEPPPRPPLREGLPLGQPPVRPSLGADAPLPQVIGTLKHEASAALARVQLAQFASRAATIESDAMRPAERQWVCELPITMAGGTGIGQFHLVEEHEARDSEAGEGGTEAARLWKMRFSVDSPEEGPIFSQINCRDGTISVFLSSERPETLARLQRDLTELVSALEGAGLSLDTVQCHAIVPEPEPAPPGLFVDRAS